MVSIEVVKKLDSLAAPLAVSIKTEKDSRQVQVLSNIPDSAFLAQLSSSLTAVGADCALGESCLIPSPLDSRYPLIASGLTETSSDALRQAAGAAIRAGQKALSKYQEKDSAIPPIVIALPHDHADQLQAILEGALLGAYQFTAYQQAKKAQLQKIIVLSAVENPEKIIAKAQLIAQAVYQVRDLVNTPARDLNPQDLADIAVAEAAKYDCQAKVFAGADLAKEQLAGIAAVGAGSATPPRLVRVEWAPAQANYSIALVGKGITFDSGGYSLKPPTSMVDMKTDMTGAATVLAATLSAARLNLPIRVTAWLCLAENMVSASSIRPDDVITYRNGKSVEINNTDAEGRLVLADGLLMACAEEPDEVIDIATLTGAAVVALGERLSGIMGTPEIRKAVRQAADTAGEAAWEMPLPAHLATGLRSRIADMKNSGKRPGGMLVAGLFLQNFVGNTPWAHIDIAGPAFNNESAYGYTPAGATGIMLRTLVQHLENKCQN